jgi:hypothetical protein
VLIIVRVSVRGRGRVSKRDRVKFRVRFSYGPIRVTHLDTETGYPGAPEVRMIMMMMMFA